MTDPQPTIQRVALPSPRQAAIGSAVAILVATVAMVFFILPAELGVDLTGFGAKTGLTGLAQIQGFRGEITEPEKLRQRIHWDLYYLVHWSIWMDLRIIAVTAVQVVFPPKTAY